MLDKITHFSTLKKKKKTFSFVVNNKSRSHNYSLTNYKIAKVVLEIKTPIKRATHPLAILTYPKRKSTYLIN